jgi:hypothetical protein
LPICRAAPGFSRSIGHRSLLRDRLSMHRRRCSAAVDRDGAGAPEYLRSLPMPIWTTCAGIVPFAATTVSFAAGRERFGIKAASKATVLPGCRRPQDAKSSPAPIHRLARHVTFGRPDRLSNERDPLVPRIKFVAGRADGRRPASDCGYAKYMISNWLASMRRSEISETWASTRLLIAIKRHENETILAATGPQQEQQCSRNAPRLHAVWQGTVSALPMLLYPGRYRWTAEFEFVTGVAAI